MANPGADPERLLRASMAQSMTLQAFVAVLLNKGVLSRSDVDAAENVAKRTAKRLTELTWTPAQIVGEQVIEEIDGLFSVFRRAPTDEGEGASDRVQDPPQG